MQIGASYTAQWLEQICYIYMVACLAACLAAAFTEAISEMTFHISLMAKGTIVFTPI